MRLKPTGTMAPPFAATAIAIAIVMAAIAGTSVSAAEVWRCGNSYSDRPCGDGQAMDVEDARSSDQQRDAVQGVKANSAAASDLERQRHSARARQPSAVLIDAPATFSAAKPKPRSTSTSKAKAKSRKGKGGSTTDDFVATYPTPAQDKKKSRKGTGTD